MRRQLAEAGLDPARVARLHAPIGLAIGAKTAQEIALSILAQIVEIKSHRQLTEGFTPEIRAAWAQCRQEQTDAVLATIVSRHGSMPREVGTKMLILPDGSTAGSVGGGIMEYRARQLAGKMLGSVRKFRSSWRRLPRDWKTMRKHWQPVAARWNFSYRF